MIYKPFFTPNSDYKYTIFSCKMQVFCAKETVATCDITKLTLESK